MILGAAILSFADAFTLELKSFWPLAGKWDLNWKRVFRGGFLFLQYKRTKKP
jgi:hypothetical protein